MTKLIQFIKGMTLCCSLAIGTIAGAQTNVSTGQTFQATAILDTAIPFAIGAREAEQSIRGSFGWQTFQEGFVKGVYFRFDPDGYARFSPSSRLDEDLFEVICAKGSTTCIARKPGMEIGLSTSGQIQLNFPEVAAGDSFFVSDRKSEIQLPPSILEPLDIRLEGLLAAEGEINIRRQQEPIHTISLKGFSAVATYLRWVAQGQSSRVFPRDWPVPASNLQQAQSTITQPVFQQTQNLQTIRQPAQWSQPQNQTQQPLTGTGYGFPNQAAQPYPAAPSNEVADLRQTVAQLQNSLNQLTNTPGPGFNTGYPGATVNTTSNVDETGILFAQQAQGRSLPLAEEVRSRPSGFGSAQTPLAPSGSSYADFSPAPTGTTGDLGQVLAAIGVLSSRIAALERTILNLHRAQVGAVVPNNIQARPLSNGEFGGVQPGLPNNGLLGMVNSAPTSEAGSDERTQSLLSSIESLLMGQMASDPAASPRPLTTTGLQTSQPQVPIDRGVVEEILNKLDDGTQPLAHSTGIIAPTASQGEKDDFVALSDYINFLLKSEDKQATGN